MKNARKTPKDQASAVDKRDSATPQGDLFGQETVPMYRSLPRQGTLLDELLSLFLTGESVTQPQWLERTGSWRLAATVQALDDDHGWQVRSLEIPAPSRRCPHRTIARYSLPQAEIQHGRELRQKGGSA
jgi:hypothetical protein